MTAFRDQSWRRRYEKMGDQAEQAFREWADERGIAYEEYGLRRPKVKVEKLPARIRYQPDFLCDDYLVECIGCGKDKTAKLAIYKWNCLQYWNTIHPVYLFIWHSTKKQGYFVALSDINALIDSKDVTLDSFPEGKAYFGIGIDDLAA
jgi:hypothetical protein